MVASFGKPLDNARVTGGWGDGRPELVGSYHYAIDMEAPTGTAIYSSQGGTVIAADRVGASTSGKFVVVKEGQVATRYLHMSEVLVEVGQQVGRGEKIGLVGSTGFSSVPHLHLDVFLGPDKLAEFQASHATPRPGYPAEREYGTQVPAEPLIPVDSYTDQVMANAAARGVPLYEGGGFLKIALAVAAGYAIYALAS